MICKVKYATPSGKIIEGLFDKIGGRYYQIVIDKNSYLDQANKILESNPYMDDAKKTKDLRYGRQNNKFGDWMREKLAPSSTGLCIADFDWILWNYKTKDLQLIEEKTEKGYVNTWIKRLNEEVFKPALEKYCKEKGINYHGYNLVHFENKGPTDGKIKFGKDLCNEKEITEEELINLLNMSQKSENEELHKIETFKKETFVRNTGANEDTPTKNNG